LTDTHQISRPIWELCVQFECGRNEIRRATDAVSLYFADATLASAFAARSCAGSKAETAGGVFHMREDEPALQIGAGLHRTP
jgi:hypothetical protein